MEEKRYIRTVDGNIIENNESGSRIIDILMNGDLVRIEYYSSRYKRRISRLFEVEVEGITNNREFIHLYNGHMDFLIANGNYLHQDLELKPVITAIFTVEKLESIKYNLFQPKLKCRKKETSL